MDWPLAIYLSIVVLAIAAMSIGYSWRPKRRCKCECHAKHVADAPPVEKPL